MSEVVDRKLKPGEDIDSFFLNHKYAKSKISATNIWRGANTNSQKEFEGWHFQNDIPHECVIYGTIAHGMCPGRENVCEAW